MLGLRPPPICFYVSVKSWMHYKGKIQNRSYLLTKNHTKTNSGIQKSDSEHCATFEMPKKIITRKLWKKSVITKKIKIRKVWFFIRFNTFLIFHMNMGGKVGEGMLGGWISFLSFLRYGLFCTQNVQNLSSIWKW